MNAFDLSLDGGLLEASAGTGKTYTLTTLYLRLLLERLLPVESILVVTFTNAATAELRLKLRQRLRLVERALRRETLTSEEREATAPFLTAQPDAAALLRHVEDSVQRFDAAPILTIHGFCSRLLSELAFESGGDLWFELSDLSGELLGEHVEETLAKELGQLSVEEVELLRPHLQKLSEEQKILQSCLQQPQADIRPTRSAVPDLKRARATYSAAVERVRQQVIHDGPRFSERLLASKRGLKRPTMERRLAVLAALPSGAILDRD